MQIFYQSGSQTRSSSGAVTPGEKAGPAEQLQRQSSTSAPPGGFCRECTRAELEESRAALDDLGAGLNWPNGARVSIFGDEEIRWRFQQKRSERNMYVAMQRWGQRGTAAIGVLLLIAFGLMRQVGVDQRARKTGHKQLTRGDGWVLVAALAMIGLAAGAGALVGWILIGWGAAVA